MLRSNIRLILGGVAALALGLAGGWALLAVAFEEPAAPAMQTSAVTRAIATDSREPSPAVATPSPDSEPSAPAAKLEPASPTPTPIRVAEPVPRAPFVVATDATPRPAVAPTAGKHTKVSMRVSAKRRVQLRDDDDDDDC
jgi:hypothetical protein